MLQSAMNKKVALELLFLYWFYTPKRRILETKSFKIEWKFNANGCTSIITMNI